MPGDRVRSVIRWCALTVVLLISLSARAQVALTTQAVNVRAGPDRSFPLVTWLNAGTPVNVIGCVEGWRWCDVVVGPYRGWIYSRFLAYTYQGQPTVILYGGPQLGLPLLTFSIASYWDTYYRGRPWWNDRYYWYGRPPPPPPAWRPPPPRPPHGGPRPPPRPPQAGPAPPRPPQGSPPSRPPKPPNTGKPPGSQPPPGNRPPGGRPPPGSKPPAANQPLPPGPRPGAPPVAGRPMPRSVPDSRP